MALPRATPVGKASHIEKNDSTQSETGVEQQKATPSVEAHLSPPQPEPVPQPKMVARFPADCETYRPIVSKYGWNVTVAMRVMQAESGCNPLAVNPTDNHKVCRGSFGLFQISCHSGRIFDPEQNVAIAWSKYRARGWKPWGVCNNGKVRCY